MLSLRLLVDSLHNSSSNLFYGSLPIVDQQNRWRVGASNLRHQFWRVHYSEMNEIVENDCVVSDAAGSTRVYTSKMFRESMAMRSKVLAMNDTLRGGVELDPQDGKYSLSSFYVDLDLSAKLLGVKALTCLYGHLQEEHYLSKARLSPWLAFRHAVEVVEFWGRREEMCVVKPQLDSMFQHINAGRVTTPCFRRSAEAEIRNIARWWIELDPGKNKKKNKLKQKVAKTKFLGMFLIFFFIIFDPGRHFITLKQGTVLTGLMRGGDLGMMPWDRDLEMVLLSTGPISFFGMCKEFVGVRKAQCIAAKIRKRLGKGIGMPLEDVDEESLSFGKFQK